MKTYKLVSSYRILEKGYHCDPLEWDLEILISAYSLKDAVQKFIKTKAFDKHLREWQTVWIYLKALDGRVDYIPAYDDLEI